MDHRDYAATWKPLLYTLPNVKVDEDKLKATFTSDPDELEEGEEVSTFELRLCWEVCGTCNGKGKHVNPSIDAHGISAEELFDDPGFREEYFSGFYDVTCYSCKGRTTILAVDERFSNKKAIKEMNRHFDEEEDYRSICDAERRMGA